MIRILVCGGTGFIGSAILNKLENLPHDIEINATYWSNSPINTGRINWHKCNLLNYKSAEQLLNNLRPTHLIQAAWYSVHGDYWSSCYNLDWLKASLNLLSLFEKYGGQRCVFIGSSAEYAWTNDEYLNENLSICNPASLYGASKLSLYLILSRFANQRNISWAWVRLFNPFGQFENRKRLIPRVCLSMIKGEELEFDSGTSKRDFLHVDDAANAVVKILFSKLESAVNIGLGIPIAVKDIIKSIAEYFGKPHLLKFDTILPNDPNQFIVPDITLLNKNIDWTPAFSLGERINQVCEWWAAQINKR